MLLTPPLAFSASHNDSHHDTHNKIIDIPKISGSMVIDANLTEPQWKSAKKILINNVTRPYDNIPSPVHTEALLIKRRLFLLSFYR